MPEIVSKMWIDDHQSLKPANGWCVSFQWKAMTESHIETCIGWASIRLTVFLKKMYHWLLKIYPKLQVPARWVLSSKCANNSFNCNLLYAMICVDQTFAVKNFDVSCISLIFDLSNLSHHTNHVSYTDLARRVNSGFGSLLKPWLYPPQAEGLRPFQSSARTSAEAMRVCNSHSEWASD